jgi:hypothetical protein
MVARPESNKDFFFGTTNTPPLLLDDTNSGSGVDGVEGVGLSNAAYPTSLAYVGLRLPDWLLRSLSVVKAEGDTTPWC